MNNLALCESLTLREDSIRGLSQDKALETLDKAKALLMAVHQGNGFATTEQVAEYFELSVDAIESVIRRHREELISDGFKVVRGKDLKELLLAGSVTKTEPEKITVLSVWAPRSMLRCGMLLRDSQVAKQVRNVLLDIAGSKESINKLEQQFIPDVPLKQLDEYAAIMGKRFGAAYEQQLLVQSIRKFHPHLPTPPVPPGALASLPTAKALLNPTQIAEQVGIFCKSNPKKGSAQQVNILLEKLGYQTKIDGIWSATDKAIGLNLCDRKPVDTGSHTQKDQLFWSVDVVAILQEYTAQPLALTLS